VTKRRGDRTIGDRGKNAGIGESLHVESERGVRARCTLVAERRQQRQTRQRLQRAIELAHVDAMQWLTLWGVELQRAHALDRHLTAFALHVAHRDETGVDAERAAVVRTLEADEKLMAASSGLAMVSVSPSSVGSLFSSELPDTPVNS
jgi:hypothetical protein